MFFKLKCVASTHRGAARRQMWYKSYASLNPSLSLNLPVCAFFRFTSYIRPSYNFWRATKHIWGIFCQPCMRSGPPKHVFTLYSLLFVTYGLSMWLDVDFAVYVYIAAYLRALKTMLRVVCWLRVVRDGLLSRLANQKTQNYIMSIRGEAICNNDKSLIE